MSIQIKSTKTSEKNRKKDEDEKEKLFIWPMGKNYRETKKDAKNDSVKAKARNAVSENHREKKFFSHI